MSSTIVQKQKFAELVKTNQALEERLAQLQSDLDCVLKDNEEKNREIASLSLDVKVQ